MLKKSLAVCFLMIMASLAQAVQTPPDWVRYSSTEGRYNVLVPKEPSLNTQEGSASTGEKFIQYMAEASDTDSFYSITYFDYASNMNFSLDKARDGMVNAITGTLLSEQAISLGGYPGRELKISAKHAGFDLLVRARIYDIGRRVYSLQQVVQKSADSPTVAEKATRFFDSFKLTQNK